MTEKLYDADSFLKEFEATVVSCQEQENGQYKVILDRTAFFPEEGGQCCDTGTLSGAAVTYVQISPDGIITHITDKALSGKVTGEIDFKKRFRNMQNHTGEHILSGIIYKKYGFNNVGFHLGDTEITMDVDGILTREQLDEIELLANGVVYDNVKVTGYYPDKEILKTLNYRSKKEIDGDIRIVNIKDVDDCACCAPHVKFTGEVGIIKILDFMKMRGGIRLNIKCGFDALESYNDKYRNVREISLLLKAPQNETAVAVEALVKDNKGLKYKICELKRELTLLRAERVEKAMGNLCLFEEDFGADDLRFLANAVKNKCTGVCAVLSGNDNSGYNYCLASDSVDLKEKSAEINKALNGRGGGSRVMIFGSFNATKEQILNFFQVS